MTTSRQARHWFDYDSACTGFLACCRLRGRSVVPSGGGFRARGSIKENSRKIWLAAVEMQSQTSALETSAEPARHDQKNTTLPYRRLQNRRKYARNDTT